MKNNTLYSLGILVGALGTAAYSCSPASDAPPGFGLGATGSGASGGMAAKGGTTGSGGTTSGGTTSGGTTSGGSSSGGTSPGSGGGGIDVDASGDVDMTVDEDAACGTGEANGSLKEVNMFVMFDRSWSMTECGDGTPFTSGDPRCMTGPSRWQLTSEALKAFFQDAGAAGLRVALRFFPDPDQGCTGFPTMGGGMMGGRGMMGGVGFGGMSGTAGGSGTAGSPAAGGAGATLNCDTDSCSVPLVDIAPLLADPAPADVQEQKLLDAITASAPPDVATLNPNPQTPTSAALAGATKWATTYKQAHMDEEVVVILITDGEPQGCDTNTTNIASIAGAAYMTAGVPTYVIGLGSLSTTGLDQIARAGGTEKTFTVSDGASATSDLLAKLVAIRGMALSCDIAVPKATSSGKTIDLSLINVDYVNGTDGMTTEFGLVGSEAECGGSLGWYYDNPSAPTQILLCPAACEQIKNDKDATVKIRAGCKPHVIPK